MNVIAVDDERFALDTLVDSIEKSLPEAKAYGFSKPEKALEFVLENGAEIAFLDIKMRGMTGLELAKRLKDIKGDINIVFVTGYSEYTLDAFRLYASDYILKPATPEAVKTATEHLRYPVKPKREKKIRFQCFGNFEAYADDKPLIFGRTKAKELLAHLVDSDGADTNSRQSNLRNLIAELRHVFLSVGAENVIVKSRNRIAVNREAVDCDYYDFLRHIPSAVNSYRGEYMSQYSWAEITTASLPQCK